MSRLAARVPFFGVQGAPGAQVGVLIVDDDPMVRGWVRLSLDGTDFRVVGEAGTADEAAPLIERRQPHIVLVDQNLGGESGIAFVRSLRHGRVRMIVMTALPQRGFNETAREAGAHGTLLKSGSAEDLLETLTTVSDGGERFDARHPRRAAGRGALSPREREVLKLVAAGRSNREIAAELGVADETVKTMLARTFAKLGVRKRAEAVAIAHKQGLL